MVGSELMIRRPGNLNVSQEAARATLREVRQQGHTYVELREVGRRTIFFCTLCLTPCYSDTVLFDHLRGNLHARRHAAARATLFGPVPWPFNDGVLFFSQVNDDITADARERNGPDVNGREELLNLSRVLPGDMKAFFSGCGQVASRISNMTDGASKILRIWCAWLGEGEIISKDLPECDFAVINFLYDYDLGRPRDWDNMDSSLSSGYRNSKKLRYGKSDDDDDDDKDGVVGVDDDADAKNGCLVISADRNFRRELRRQKRLAAERMCDICGQSMLKSKDVAALLNCKTWNIACSSRNTHGAFHVFHTSCLIHWILLCESEAWNPKSLNKKMNRGRKGKKAAKPSLSSILCPECQGTGIIVEENNLEKPSIPLSQMFQYKLKAIESHKFWMKNPETLEQCSTGLCFPTDFEENAEEQAVPMKLLHFYHTR